MRHVQGTPQAGGRSSATTPLRTLGTLSAYLKRCLWDSYANQEEAAVSIWRLPNAKPKSFVVLVGGYEIAGKKERRKQ